MGCALARLTGLGVLLFVSAGCGSSSESTGSERETAARTGGDPKETCALLTADEIQTVMGTAPAEPRFEGNQCAWASQDGSEQFLVQMIVTPSPYKSFDEVAETYREQMDADPAEAIEPIEGVGLFAIGLKGMAMVQIFTGTHMVQVATSGKEQDRALELAKKAVARLE